MPTWLVTENINNPFIHYLQTAVLSAECLASIPVIDTTHLSFRWRRTAGPLNSKRGGGAKEYSKSTKQLYLESDLYDKRFGQADLRHSNGGTATFILTAIIIYFMEFRMPMFNFAFGSSAAAASITKTEE